MGIGRRQVLVDARMAEQHEIRARIADGVGGRQLIERVQDLGRQIFAAFRDDEQP